ncbi:hypothetical protein ACIPI6_02865 [Pseudomonas protegens]|uniref:hypothetical protein n=1 Tax=Pseudomonas protegens TaxID=380021 RepID=UPI0038115902
MNRQGCQDPGGQLDHRKTARPGQPADHPGFQRHLALPAEQQAEVLALLDCDLSDQLYTLLLGLEGAARVGGLQHDFVLYNEAGQALTGSGELKAEAYAQLHEPPA